ncbi:hypothetical protein QR685DRAFT_575072 [Neurospora intermedia]|uniref:Uncharacterized protein n=1 Tax=Neurospora intermedia TaxID=5142 RepID=A0ABR3D420_NEUIN
MLFGSGSVLRPVRLSLGELSNTRGQVISCAPNDTDTGSQSQVLCATNTTVGIFLAIHGERCHGWKTVRRHHTLGVTIGRHFWCASLVTPFGLAGCDVDCWVPSSRPSTPPPPAPPVPTTGHSRRHD